MTKEDNPMIIPSDETKLGGEETGRLRRELARQVGSDASPMIVSSDAAKDIGEETARLYAEIRRINDQAAELDENIPG